MSLDAATNSDTLKGVTTKIAQDTSEKTSKTTEKTTPDKGGFAEILTRILTPNGQNEINEEELFAGIMEQRITKLKGEEVGKAFHDKLGSGSSVEEAARSAMKALVAEGKLTEAEGMEIHAQSFKAAQLDDNKEALFDGKGGPGDPTIAVAQMDAALLSARTIIEKIDSGEDKVGELTLNVGNTGLPNVKVATLADGTFKSDTSATSTGSVVDGNPVDGAEGFLFKPVSESDGKLVVILPKALTNQIDSVSLLDSDEKELDEGRAAGVANVGREHFRFSKAGSDYGKEITVQIQLKSGETKEYKISDPSKRYD